jgi:hypothetical protein
MTVPYGATAHKAMQRHLEQEAYQQSVMPAAAGMASIVMLSIKRHACGGRDGEHCGAIHKTSCLRRQASSDLIAAV